MDWITTFEALKSVYVDEAFSNIAINEAIEHHKGCQIGFVRTFAKGVIRDTIRLDFLIDQLADKGVKGIKNRTLIVLRMGLYAITSLNSVPDYAAVNETVKLSRKVSKGSDKFVNAILRSYLRKRDEIAMPESLGIKYSFPESVVELLSSQYEDDIENLLQALNKPAAFIIRRNTLKCKTVEELIDILAKEAIKAEPVDESELALVCDRGNVISSKAYREGLFTVQSLPSIMAIESLKPEKGSRILDMCAAPGGKTTALAEMIGDDGEIVACDVYEHRLELINKTAERLGISCIHTEILDGTVHNESFENGFDYILADVPCSGLGVIPSKPEIKLRTDVSKYDELVEIQYTILQNAISYVKPGGYIEYSTCTLNKNENECVVNRAIEAFSSVEIVEKKTIMPYNNKIGFFYCKLRKNA